jgi:hypothetical protein
MTEAATQRCPAAFRSMDRVTSGGVGVSSVGEAEIDRGTGANVLGNPLIHFE